MELVERDAVLAELAEMLDESAGGEGRLALVSGEAGVGKTAVVRQFSDVGPGAARMLEGACDPLATPRPLGPLSDIAAVVGGELARLLDAESGPAAVFDAFLRVLAASPDPVVVVLEDVHWADQATLDLLSFVGRRVSRTRALLVVTFRDDELEPDHPLRVAIGTLPAAPVVRRLPLEPLSEHGVASLARGKHLDPGRLYRLSGGNPFFLTELLAAQGEELPETVRDAVLARAGGLSAPARGGLDALAAVGRPVEPALLANLGVAAAHVDAGVARGLLRWDQGRIAFRHELARSALLAAVPRGRAARLHARILATLRAVPGRGDLAELAWHAEEAGDGEAVLEYAPAAALEAERLISHREAAAQWARALRFAHQLPATRRADLYRAHSREAHLSADSDAAVASGRAELELRRSLGDPLEIGRALYWLSLLVWATEDQADAMPLALEAVSLLEREPPGARLATAYVTVAGLHGAAAQGSQASVYARKALRLADELGLVDVKVRALRALGAAKLCGPNGDGWPELEQALELALTTNLLSETAVAFDTLLWFGAMHRDFDRFETFFAPGLEFCDRHDLTRWRLGMLPSRCVELMHRGQWSEAGELAQALLGHTGMPIVDRIQPLYVLGRLRARRGDPQAWEALDEALSLSLPRNELQHVGNVRAVRAEAAWLEGDRRRMVEEAEAAYDLALPVEDPWILGELALWLWRGETLEVLPAVVGPHPYGLQILGDWSAAAAAWERLGCPFEQAAALLDSDDEQALRRAMQIFDGLGARPAVAMAARKLRALGVRRVPRGAQRSTLANPYNLTRRQYEVLELVGEGLTDAEIGERLFLSTKTVNHHVSAALAKLGVRSRAQAAALLKTG